MGLQSYWVKQIAHQHKVRSASGMTILEVMVVILIIGILSAIAAPGWVAFANRQRTSRAADQVLQAIRTAQSDAKRTRRTRSVTFDTASNIPKVNGVELGEGELKLVGLSVVDSKGAISEVTFESTGGLDDDSIDLPVYITVGVPDTNSAKKCVIIRSLLGATKIGRDAECNS